MVKSGKFMRRIVHNCIYFELSNRFDLLLNNLLKLKKYDIKYILGILYESSIICPV